jgi:hypothetical protein
MAPAAGSAAIGDAAVGSGADGVLTAGVFTAADVVASGATVAAATGASAAFVASPADPDVDGAAVDASEVRPRPLGERVCGTCPRLIWTDAAPVRLALTGKGLIGAATTGAALIGVVRSGVALTGVGVGSVSRVGRPMACGVRGSPAGASRCAGTDGDAEPRSSEPSADAVSEDSAGPDDSVGLAGSVAGTAAAGDAAASIGAPSGSTGSFDFGRRSAGGSSMGICGSSPIAVTRRRDPFAGGIEPAAGEGNIHVPMASCPPSNCRFDPPGRSTRRPGCGCGAMVRRKLDG